MTLSQHSTKGDTTMRLVHKVSTDTASCSNGCRYAHTAVHYCSLSSQISQPHSGGREEESLQLQPASLDVFHALSTCHCCHSLCEKSSHQGFPAVGCNSRCKVTCLTRQPHRHYQAALTHTRVTQKVHMCVYTRSMECRTSNVLLTKWSCSSNCFACWPVLSVFGSSAVCTSAVLPTPFAPPSGGVVRL